MDYEAQVRRQWEVNVYHDLGFIYDGYTIEETDRGHKNETREATSIEAHMWARFETETPEIPRIQVSDDLDLAVYLDLAEMPEIEKQALSERFIWLENKYDLTLFCKRSYGGWHREYNEIKDIRTPL